MKNSRGEYIEQLPDDVGPEKVLVVYEPVRSHSGVGRDGMVNQYKKHHLVADIVRKAMRIESIRVDAAVSAWLIEVFSYSI
jgi:hypothetical protein